jgi:hypothetical protein
MRCPSAGNTLFSVAKPRSERHYDPVIVEKFMQFARARVLAILGAHIDCNSPALP